MRIKTVFLRKPATIINLFKHLYYFYKANSESKYVILKVILEVNDSKFVLCDQTAIDVTNNIDCTHVRNQVKDNFNKITKNKGSINANRCVIEFYITNEKGYKEFNEQKTKEVLDKLKNGNC